MKLVLPAALAGLWLATSALAADDVADTSFKDAAGHRVQQLSIVVTATPAEVWTAIATDAGRERWAVPVSHIDLRNDGIMEASYDLDAKIGVSDNIQNRILAFVPEQFIAVQTVHVPKGAPFDPVLILALRSITRLEAVDAAHTRVTEIQVGYGEGAGYDDMYRHFHDGNAYELRELACYFAKGPVDWRAEAARADASVHKPAAQ